MIGIKNVKIVKEQEMPDPDFSTVKSPNPEEKEGFTIAIEMAKKEDIDLIIATDPDCDRVGIVVRDKDGNYVTFTGNQVGALLTEFILRSKKERGLLPSNGAVLKKESLTTPMCLALKKATDILQAHTHVIKTALWHQCLSPKWLQTIKHRV